jgi:hypothetical protein
MSNHKDSLVKVLEYLVNEEREKASDLLHDIFVEKAKNHWAALSESDESVEEDIQEEDLDETYDVNEEEVEEAIDAYDAEEDFLDDIETAEDEIEAEEVFGEDEDEMDADDAEMDLAMDMEDEGEEAEADDAEEAMANVEDAIAELRAAFADLMGDEEAPADEEEAEMEMEATEEVEGLDEGAELSAVKVSHTDGSDNADSPVGPGDDSLGEGTPVDFAAGEEKGGKAPAAKDMGVTGPEAAGDLSAAPAPKREMK